jgi:hypothetical protein
VALCRFAQPSLAALVRGECGTALVQFSVAARARLAGMQKRRRWRSAQTASCKQCDRFSIMSELRKSAVWAAVIAFPMVLFAASSSMWFAHAAGWFGVMLFAPMFGAMLLRQPNAPLSGVPEFLVLVLGAAGQFLLCLLAVLAVRAIARRGSQ